MWGAQLPNIFVASGSISMRSLLLSATLQQSALGSAYLLRIGPPIHLPSHGFYPGNKFWDEITMAKMGGAPLPKMGGAQHRENSFLGWRHMYRPSGVYLYWGYTRIIERGHHYGCTNDGM